MTQPLALPKSLIQRIRNEDIEVLRSKFAEADHLVKTFENAREQFQAYVSNKAVIFEQKDQREILLAVKDGMALHLGVGAAHSLIETELATVRAVYKQGQMGRDEELNKSIGAHFATIGRFGPEKDPADLFCEALYLAKDILDVIEFGLKPMGHLRKLFADELARRAASLKETKVGTPKHRAREQMRARIRELAKSCSGYADIYTKGLMDPVIQECMESGVKFTPEVIRHTLKPHPAHPEKKRQNRK